MNLRLVLLAAVLAAAGCDSTSTETEEEGLFSVHVSMSSLEPLPGGFHYAGWAEQPGGEMVAVGSFSADPSGSIVDLDGNRVIGGKFTASEDLTNTTDFLVTIESGGSGTETPSATHLVAGPIEELEATLTVQGGIHEAIGSSSGTFILATPTNGPDSDENSGVWFINITGGQFARGLLIPYPLAGWSYHGWVDIDGITVATGPILGPNTADGAAPHSGSLEGFNFPGEDFLVNPPNGLTFPTPVGSASVYVTIEPEPDPDPGPSYFVLLRGSVPGNPSDSTNYMLDSFVDNLPRGRVRITE